MADLTPNPGNDQTRSRTPGQPPAMPRWVKTFAIITLVFVALFIALHLAGLAPFMQHGSPQP